MSIRLFDCTNVATDANGVSTFSGTNPGGTGNVAQEDGTVSSNISVVNGAVNTGGGVYEADVNSADGTVDFSVDTTGAAGQCFVAVVWDDADNDDRLDLNADGTPSEDFANTGDVTVIRAEEANDSAAINGTVEFVNAAADVFSTEDASYYYDSNDEYILVGTTNTPLTMEQFEDRLSNGDTVTGTYRTNSANQSTFRLTDVAPLAPASLTAQEPQTGTNDGKQGIELVWPDSNTGTTASYNVFRATATQPAITGQPVSCPTIASGAFSQIGTVADEAGKTTYAFLDSTAALAPADDPADPSYCYYVTAVDQTGDEGPASEVEGPQTAFKADAPSTAPTFTDAATATYDGTTPGSETFDVVLTYSENVTDATTHVTDFRVVYTVDGTSYNLPVDAEVTATNTVTLTVDASAAPAPSDDLVAGTSESITVTAQTGTDGNTVGDTDTPQQFQPVGDAVFIGDADIT